MNITREEIYELLKRHFNRDEFAPGQAEAISCVLSGKDVLAVKGHIVDYEICYMFPALIIDGIVVVISQAPDEYKPDSILTSICINHSITSSHLQSRLSEIIAGRYKIIHVAPEHFQNRAFLFALNKIPVSLVVVDDAQCLSQSRYDFNYNYTYIARAICDMDTQPNILAITNSYKPEIHTDIIERLQMEQPEIINLGSGFPEENNQQNISFPDQELPDFATEQDRIFTGILRCAEKTDGLLGRRDMTRMLIGQHTKRIAKYGFDHVEDFGYLSDVPKDAVLKGIDELLELGCLQITSLFFPMIQLTDAGRRRFRRIASKRIRIDKGNEL